MQADVYIWNKFRAHESEQCTIQLPNRFIESRIYNYLVRRNSFLP